MNILYVAPITTCSGYGEKARDFSRFLLSEFKNDNLDILSTRWGDCSLECLGDSDTSKLISQKILLNQPQQEVDIAFHMSLPNEFKQFGKFNIGLTSGIETDLCCDDFIHGCNRMNLVLVPSKFTRDTILNTSSERGIKCNTPIEVVFEGCGDDIIKSQEGTTHNTQVDDIKEDFCFLSVGQWTEQTDRKNFTCLIESFCKSFQNTNNPPALILKTSGTSYCIKDQLELEKRIHSIASAYNKRPPIYLLYGNLTTSELHELYSHKKVKCLITLTHGEGFGRPLLEASMNGLPIIASKWSGHLDFLTEKYTKLVPGEIKKCDFLSDYTHTNANWFYVDKNKVNMALHDMVNRYEIHKKRANKLMSINLKKFTLDAMAQRYSEILKKYI